MTSNLTTHILYINVMAEININEESKEFEDILSCKEISAQNETSLQQQKINQVENIVTEDLACMPSEELKETETRSSTNLIHSGEGLRKENELQNSGATEPQKQNKWIPKLRCTECDYATRNYNFFKRHMLGHDFDDYQSSDSNSDFKIVIINKCSDCDYEIIDKNEFKRHLLTHSEGRLQKCDYADNLEQHSLNINSDTKLLKCLECHFVTPREGDLKRHALLHAGSNQYKCTECSYETNMKRDLTRHAMLHTETKQYKCSKCSYETDRNSDLTRHQFTHSTSTKLYHCRYCSFETNYKAGLKRHARRRHSETRWFSCSECYYETVERSSFRNHLKTHS